MSHLRQCAVHNHSGTITSMVILFRIGHCMYFSIKTTNLLLIEIHKGTVTTTDTVLCPNLDDPSNGSVSVNYNFVGGRAYYSCNFGYRLSHYSSRRCQLSGTWSGTQPTCISKHNFMLRTCTTDYHRTAHIK